MASPLGAADGTAAGSATRVPAATGGTGQRLRGSSRPRQLGGAGVGASAVTPGRAGSATAEPTGASPASAGTPAGARPSPTVARAVSSTTPPSAPTSAGAVSVAPGTRRSANALGGTPVACGTQTAAGGAAARSRSAGAHGPRRPVLAAPVAGAAPAPARGAAVDGGRAGSGASGGGTPSPAAVAAATGVFREAALAVRVVLRGGVREASSSPRGRRHSARGSSLPGCPAAVAGGPTAASTAAAAASRGASASSQRPRTMGAPLPKRKAEQPVPAPAVREAAARPSAAAQHRHCSSGGDAPRTSATTAASAAATAEAPPADTAPASAAVANSAAELDGGSAAAVTAPGQHKVDVPAVVVPSRSGDWEVHTVKKGWAPLAPALQPALDAAMASTAEMVEVLVDPVARSWVPNPAAVGDDVRHRCVVYLALPHQQLMGKVGGEPPRPVRWRRAGADEAGFSGSAAAAPPTASVADGCAAAAGAGTAAVGGSPVAPAVGSTAAAAEEHLGDTAAAREPGVPTAEEEDPLAFTAKPADGVVIHSAVFERLQHGVSARHAGHRYAGQVLAS